MCKRPPQAHDLLWLDHPGRLVWTQPRPEWTHTLWTTALPVVVRRDSDPAGLIPVGLRGARRSERAAAWLPADAITRIVSPEMLIAGFLATAAGKRAQNQLTYEIRPRPAAYDEHFLPGLSPDARALPVVRALSLLASTDWPWPWGVTGSVGYMLATGQTVSRPDSDLDLLIRCPRPASASAFTGLLKALAGLPCRADIQLETPHGGCALMEWLRGGKVMLKTSFGPRLMENIWEI